MTDLLPIEQESWLTLTEEQQPGKSLRTIPPEDEQREEMAVAALTNRQRAYLPILLKHCFVHAPAMRELGSRAPSRKTLSFWSRDPKYIHAVALVKKAALQRAGIEAASVLLRINELIESGRERITTTDCNGNTDTHPRDANASANLKILAQFVGVAEPETAPASRTGPGLVINFIHGAEPVKGVTIEQQPDNAIVNPQVIK